ncbi:cell wall-associated NlpC family hydrolase [Bacillus ectoiniformans]|uniref:C40 family peptidase n=1 Tax=Bacillus ectoiniformans TaxID=1494429 RepID=UPI0019571E66|nr:NlpC/P60 family protein [Bacillus ectoiniformans]MBM7649231.1 cell wall-associated NlpC family hydrolase [Bacillus ectoiniformans]
MKKVIMAVALSGTLLSTPIASHAALGDQTLKSGMTHTDVQELQGVLQTKGLYPKGKTDKQFGPMTKSAVIKFQKANGLAADGIVGKYTYKKLGAAQVVKSATATKSNASGLISKAKSYQGVPYKWGGTTPSGFDCSGFLNYVFNQSSQVQLPRTVEGIYAKGSKVAAPKTGDLVFFETYKPGASHAGIYLGNNQFIHASSSKGVTISSVKDSYWSKRYLGAKSY